MQIRPAIDADIPALIEIMAPIVAGTTASFAGEGRSAEAWAALIASRRAAGRETFVADEAGHVLGYATYDQFRGNSGYRYTMEHSVYIRESLRGGGLGRALMKAVEDHAREGGAHSIFAGVDAANAGSIAFHERLGYVRVALLPQVGRKFGRWLDLVLLQKML